MSDNTPRSLSPHGMSHRTRHVVTGAALLAILWAGWLAAQAGFVAQRVAWLTEEAKTMYVYQHQNPGSGAIVTITVTDADARAHGLTFPEWVAQNLQWFPPYVPPEN